MIIQTMADCPPRSSTPAGAGSSNSSRKRAVSLRSETSPTVHNHSPVRNILFALYRLADIKPEILLLGRIEPMDACTLYNFISIIIVIFVVVDVVYVIVVIFITIIIIIWLLDSGAQEGHCGL